MWPKRHGKVIIRDIGGGHCRGDIAGCVDSISKSDPAVAKIFNWSIKMYERYTLTGCNIGAVVSPWKGLRMGAAEAAVMVGAMSLVF
jgi:hypothetical protein